VYVVLLRESACLGWLILVHAVARGQARSVGIQGHGWGSWNLPQPRLVPEMYCNRVWRNVSWAKQLCPSQGPGRYRAPSFRASIRKTVSTYQAELSPFPSCESLTALISPRNAASIWQRRVRCRVRSCHLPRFAYCSNTIQGVHRGECMQCWHGTAP
jgi:hypothetical protein